MKVLIISQSIHSSVHLPFDPKKESWSPVVGYYLTCPGPQSSTPAPQQPRTVGMGKGLRSSRKHIVPPWHGGGWVLRMTNCWLWASHGCVLCTWGTCLSQPLLYSQWMWTNVIPRRMCHMPRLALLCLCHPMRTAGTVSAKTTMVPQWDRWIIFKRQRRLQPDAEPPTQPTGAWQSFLRFCGWLTHHIIIAAISWQSTSNTQAWVENSSQKM